MTLSPGFCEVFGTTALHQACRQGNTEVAYSEQGCKQVRACASLASLGVLEMWNILGSLRAALGLGSGCVEAGLHYFEPYELKKRKSPADNGLLSMFQQPSQGCDFAGA